MIPRNNLNITQKQNQQATNTYYKYYTITDL